MTRAALAGLLALALAGCGPSFDNRFRALGPGDTRGDAVAALGQPDRAGPFLYTGGVMGPPEVLAGLVPDSTEVEVLSWTRPASGDTLAYWLYLTPGGEVLASYSNSV